MSSMDLNRNSQESLAEEDRNPSLDNFKICQKEIEELFEEYGKVLVPRIVEYEVEQCEFPVEVLNEIRAIYAHLYRASVAPKDSDIIGNIEKAKSHSKRAVLDCYKYLCVTYDNRFHEFFRKFGYINWSKSGLLNDMGIIDNKRKNAVATLRKAKEKESTEKLSGHENITPEEDYRLLYKQAHDEYLQLMVLLESLEAKIIDGHTVVSRFPAQWLALAGVCGTILGLVLGYFL